MIMQKYSGSFSFFVELVYARQLDFVKRVSRGKPIAGKLPLPNLVDKMNFIIEASVSKDPVNKLVWFKKLNFWSTESAENKTYHQGNLHATYHFWTEERLQRRGIVLFHCRVVKPKLNFARLALSEFNRNK